MELAIGTEKVNGKYFRIEERVESNGSVCLRISLAITTFVNSKERVSNGVLRGRNAFE